MNRFEHSLPASIAMSLALFLSLGLCGTAAADFVTLDVVEDTAPYSFLPSLPRYNNPTLYAFEATAEDATVHEFETYLWFDVTPAAIPAGQFVTEALLVVTYAFDYSGFGETSTEDGVLDCREVLEDWDDTTLKWTNRPVSDLPFDTITGIDSFGALICDATPIVQRWLYASRPNYGFALTSPTARVMGMYSSEASVDPALMPTLYLTTEVPEPTVTFALASGIGLLSFLARRRRPRSARSEIV